MSQDHQKNDLASKSINVSQLFFETPFSYKQNVLYKVVVNALRPYLINPVSTFPKEIERSLVYVIKHIKPCKI